MIIADDYGRERAAPVPQQAPTISGLLGGLTSEKITAGVMLLKTVRDILAPPAPPVDLTRLIEVFAANNKAQTVSDAVMIKAMDSLQQQKSGASISQQLQDLKAIRELANDVNTNESESGDTMDFIKMGLSLLPALLQKQNGDFRATGAAVKDNALINTLISDNPDLATKFFESAAAKYGVEQAKQLAAGFGYNIEQENTEQAPAAALPGGVNA